MGVIQQILSSYGGTTGPILPSFGSPLFWASLWNWQTAIPGQVLLNGNADLTAGTISPYAAEYASFINIADAPPYDISIFADQNSNANDLLGSTANPVLQITSSVVVTGGSQAGVYTFRGIDSGTAYYNLLGQPDSPISGGGFYCIDVDAGVWKITDGTGSVLYSSSDEPSFPWLASWTGITVAPQSPQTGLIEGNSDGTGGTANTGFQSTNALTLTTFFSGYVYGSIADLAASGTIFETTANGVTTTGGISLRSVAGVPTLSVKAITGLNVVTAPLIVDHNKHLFTVIIDTTLAANAQVKLLVDNVAAATRPLSTDLAGMTLANDKINVLSRNNGASDWLAFNMQTVGAYATADNSARATAIWQWQNYIGNL